MFSYNQILDINNSNVAEFEEYFESFLKDLISFLKKRPAFCWSPAKKSDYVLLISSELSGREERACRLNRQHSSTEAF